MAVRTLKGGARIKDGEPGWGLTEDDLNITYEGATLGTWEHNGYNDSDFYALVWTGEELRGIEWGTTRGWTYANSATVDATDEVKAAAAGWLAARDIESWNRATAHDALLISERGQAVEVIKGRKVPIGTAGHVLKLGENRYGTWVLFKDGDGETHITAVTNLRRTDGAESLTSVDEIVETTVNRCTRLRETGQPHEWVSAYRSRGGALGNRFSVTEDEINALLTETGRLEIDADTALQVLLGATDTTLATDGATDGEKDPATEGTATDGGTTDTAGGTDGPGGPSLLALAAKLDGKGS